MPKLYKVGEVCEIAQLQPYVLRSWEKEFPGIGIQKADDSGRLYRQADVDQVLRIKQLVFGEGLTLSGARRRLDAGGPAQTTAKADAEEVIAVLGADARKRIGHVREGLRSLLQLLNGSPAAYQLTASTAPKNGSLRAGAQRGKATTTRSKTPARSVAAKPAKGKRRVTARH
jgi:DNA-binding transcriptional MerR regulator